MRFENNTFSKRTKKLVSKRIPNAKTFTSVYGLKNMCVLIKDADGVVLAVWVKLAGKPAYLDIIDEVA